MADKTEKSTVQLIIDGDRAKVSLKELGQSLQATRKEFRLLKEADNPEEYAKKLGELQKLNQEYKDTKVKINDIKKAAFDLNDVFKSAFKGYLGGSAIDKGLDLVAAGYSKIKDKVYDLSDSLADVQKAADLSKKEVRDLNAEISKINTRTLNKELREIAEIGGRNGVSKENLAGFTKSTDMINVAFGDQFDNVTQLSESLINMRKIFSDIATDNIGDDVLHIGNALNFLEAQGTATGKGMVDFASRMGGTLIPMGATSGQILGLSATLEELSVTAERGSTAVNTIFQKMLTDVDGFARVAGMKSKDFANLLNTDIFAAFNAFIKGAKAGGAQATQFATILADTELAGSGASEVVLKLASNQDMLAKYVGSATQKLKESNSITDEFNKKNNNAAAIMDKFGKIADNALEKIALMGISAVEMFGKWLGMVDAVAAELGDLNEQQDKIIQNESQLGQLTKRYDELKAKTKLSVDEQKELSKIMNQITGIVPGAATGFDAYGNAIDINKSKVSQFIAEQHELLKVLRQSKIELLGDEYLKKQKSAQNIQDTLNKGYTEKTISTAGGSVVVKDRLTPEEVTKKQAELADLRSQLAGNRADALSQRRKNRGYGFDLIAADIPDPVETPPTTTGGTELSKADQKAADKAARDKAKKERLAEKEKRDDARDQAKLDKLREGQGDHDKYLEKQKDKHIKEGREFATAEDKFDLGVAENEATKNFNITNNALDQEAATTLNDPYKIQSINQAKLDAEEAYLTQLFLLRQTYGQDTSDLEQQLAEVSIDRAGQVAAADKKNVELQKEAAYSLQMAKAQALEEGAAALKSFFKEHTVIYKALFAVEKAGAVAQIIVSAQKEIAGYWEAYSSIPTAGPIIAGGLTAATVARSAASIATIGKQVIDVAVPGREEGGYTDMSSLRKSNSPAGYISQPTFFDLGARSYIAGENYNQEYVIPYDMLQDPTIRAMTQNLEVMRTTGRRPGTSSGSGDLSQTAGQVESLLAANVKETKSLREALEAGKIKLVFSHKEFNKSQNFMDFVQKETSL